MADSMARAGNIKDGQEHLTVSEKGKSSITHSDGVMPQGHWSRPDRAPEQQS